MRVYRLLVEPKPEAVLVSELDEGLLAPMPDVEGP